MYIFNKQKQKLITFYKNTVLLTVYKLSTFKSFSHVVCPDPRLAGIYKAIFIPEPVVVLKICVNIHEEREREMFYLTMHSTHFIYGYMASDIWLRTILIVRKETRCCHIGYSYRLTARVLLYAPSHRQDNTYHSLCYTSRGALAGTRNSSMKDRSDDPSHHERMLYL